MAQGRKNKDKGVHLLLPGLPMDGLMLVDCRKAARAEQSTLAHLMVSKPFTRDKWHLRVSANTWNVAQDQQSTEIQTTQAAAQQEA